MLFYQSWHEMNQDLTPVMLPILTYGKTWVESSIKKLGECVSIQTSDLRELAKPKTLFKLKLLKWNHFYLLFFSIQNKWSVHMREGKERHPDSVSKSFRN